jgi:hypothetical protein
VISSRCNAIKLGTETNGGFKKICISNCVIKPSKIEKPTFYGLNKGIAGIALEIVDGGLMEGVSISNIQIDGTESPIFIRLGNRAGPYQKDMIVDNIGSLSDINISHVQVKNAGNIGCSITGLPKHPVKNIQLSDIFIEQKGGKVQNDSALYIGEKEKDYPEAIMFGILPAYGFYMRHASNISVENIHLSTKQTDLRPAFYLTDVSNGILSNMQLQSSDATNANIELNDSRDIVIKSNIINGKSNHLVKFGGGQVSNISLINNLLNKSSKLYNANSTVKNIFESGNVTKITNRKK